MVPCAHNEVHLNVNFNRRPGHFQLSASDVYGAQYAPNYTQYDSIPQLLNAITRLTG